MTTSSQSLLVGFLLCALLPGWISSASAPGQSTEYDGHVSSTAHSLFPRNALARPLLHTRAPPPPEPVVCKNGYGHFDTAGDEFIYCRSADNFDHKCIKSSCNEVEFTQCHYYWGDFGDKNSVSWYMPTTEVRAARYWVDNKHGRMAVVASSFRFTDPSQAFDTKNAHGWMCNWDTKDPKGPNLDNRSKCTSCPADS